MSHEPQAEPHVQPVTAKPAGGNGGRLDPETEASGVEVYGAGGSHTKEWELGAWAVGRLVSGHLDAGVLRKWDPATGRRLGVQIRALGK